MVRRRADGLAESCGGAPGTGTSTLLIASQER